MNKNSIKIIVLSLVIAGLAFYGGIKYASAKSPVGNRAFTTQFMGVRGGVRGGMMNGGFTGGEILSKDANGITLKLQAGGSKIVFFSASTTVMKTTIGTNDDLLVGGQVTVTGKENSDGSITAQSVQVRQTR